MSSFWKDGFSLSETKTSLVMVIFFITSMFTLVMYFFDRDISDNLLHFLMSLLAVVGGINIADKVKCAIESKNSNKIETDIRR